MNRQGFRSVSLHGIQISGTQWVDNEPYYVGINFIENLNFLLNVARSFKWINVDSGSRILIGQNIKRKSNE